MTAVSPAHGGKPDIKHFDWWFATTNRLRTDGTDHLLAAADATGGQRSRDPRSGFPAWLGSGDGAGRAGVLGVGGV